MMDADLIITRAGAGTITEINTLGKVAIYIPSPYVANNHQYYNALSIVNNNAGLMIEEKDLELNVLKDTINSVLNDKKRYQEMCKNSSKLSFVESSKVIYDSIKEIIN